MISVEVEQVVLSNLGFAVLLKSTSDDRTLPIFIGASEAQAIALKLNGVEMPRPLTHDLLKNVLDFLECRLLRVEVCDLRDRTFYAVLVVQRDGEESTVDARPSDAIALALRSQAPIFVAENVMAEAGRVLDELEAEKQDADKTDEEQTDTPKKTMTPLEALKLDLQKAIDDERYEDAAKLRDQIGGLESKDNEN
ncbi:bifunctional nuclease domain-containing protein [Verrucomicrobiota bacterium]